MGTDRTVLWSIGGDRQRIRKRYGLLQSNHMSLAVCDPWSLRECRMIWVREATLRRSRSTQSDFSGFVISVVNLISKKVNLI